MHPVDNHQPAKVSENGVVLSTIKAPVIDTVRKKKQNEQTVFAACEHSFWARTHRRST